MANVKLNEEQIIKLEKLFQIGRPGLVRYGSENICLSDQYGEYKHLVDKFPIRNSDIWVTSYPKCGTTWVQEMVWLIDNDLNFEGATLEIDKRFKFLEYSVVINPACKQHIDFENELKVVSEKKNPRYMKTHIPWSLLPEEIQNGSKTPKIIYVARNPKDTCVSFYHHSRILSKYSGSFEDFCKLFLAGKLMWGPFWKNVLGFWDRRHLPNVLFLKYEDMKKDLPLVIIQVAKFLDKSLDDEQICILADHLSFDSMKRNPAVNYEALINSRKPIGCIDPNAAFLRSGKVGNYREIMSKELIDEFDVWTEKSLAGTDLTF